MARSLVRQAMQDRVHTLVRDLINTPKRERLTSVHVHESLLVGLRLDRGLEHVGHRPMLQRVHRLSRAPTNHRRVSTALSPHRFGSRLPSTTDSHE